MYTLLNRTFVQKTKAYYNILLVGSVGEGKSTTVTKIIETSTSQRTTETVRNNVKWNFCEREDFTMKLVYGPCVVSHLETTDESKCRAFDQAQRIMQVLNPGGFKALVLVMMFPNFAKTEGHKQTMSILKHAFGQHIISKYCICLVTGKEMFGNRMKIDGLSRLSFKDWCGQQRGELRDLLDECHGRVMLFDTLTSDPYVMGEQVDELIRLIKQLPGPEQYTLNMLPISRSISVSRRPRYSL